MAGDTDTTSNQGDWLRLIGLYALVAALVMLPSFIWGPGDSHSIKYNSIWVTQFGNEMAQGNLYPRWLPESFEGLGAPTFYFYPPLTFWVAGAFHALGLSMLGAINATGFIALTLSGLAMHHWLAAKGWSPRFGAIFYMVAPYHLMDFYVRGALAEFTAYIWLPLIALGITRIAQGGRITMLALAYAGLLLTHLPMTILATFFLIGPLALLEIARNKRVFMPMLAAGVIGIGLSGFYLVSALTLQGDVAINLLWRADYEASSWSLIVAGSQLTNPGLIAAPFGLALLALRARSIWTVIAVISMVGALALVPWMWNVEPFKSVQFPWRSLAILELAAITALASCRPGRVLGWLGAAVLTVVYINWSIYAVVFLNEPPSISAIVRAMPDAPEYLPRGFPEHAVREIDREADMAPWRTLPRTDTITVTRPGTTITFGHAAFPIWQVTRNGVVVPSHGPFITVDNAQPGTYRIERRMIWQEWVGALVSLFSALALLSVNWIMRRERSAQPNAATATAPVMATAA
jgi:hypothetical protein